MPAVAVVGHVEWVRFALVDHLPGAGEIVESEGHFDLAAGGGAVAAVQLAKLAGAAAFFTALGSDETAARSAAQLREHDLDVRAAARDGEQRSAFTHLSADRERTITVVGDRLVPSGGDDLGWELLDAVDAVYFTGGDVAALAHARRARVLIASARALDVVADAAVAVDVLAGSASDRGERFSRGDLPVAPRRVVRTAGRDGGSWEADDGRGGVWRAAEPPGEPVDAYGCGDSFAAGLTYALGAGFAFDAALALAARCGAAVLCGRGPYAGQLTARDL